MANIDPHDDSCQIYGRDIFNYVLTRDARYVVTTKDISNDADPKLHDRRESLVDWLMSVAHHHKTSQETFYHTVDILDRYGFLGCGNFRLQGRAKSSIVVHWSGAK